MAEVSVAGPSVAPPATSTSPTPLSTLSPREQIRIEFYKTYDVMTGVRIAATLGGFFGLMVLLVVYKSKCKSRSLSDEHLEAAVAAAVIEEEEQLALNALNLFGPRRSLGNMSAPIGRPFPRFSSLGGHNMLNPPVRLCQYGQRARVSVPVERKVVAPAHSPRLTLTSPPLKRPYPEEEEEEEEDDDYPVHFLQVPSRRASRRLSSITCSSADTSYLERRGSAVEVGHPPPPPLRRPPLPSDSWDFYYPIDIQVIQPTPLLSPCASEGTLYDHPRVSTPPPGSALAPPHLTPPSAHRLAPLASISSCQVDTDCVWAVQVSSAAPSAPGSDCHSLGSDSVFLDEECMDTEDEAEEFSTDSDVEDYAETKRQCDYNPSSVPFAEHLQMSNYPKTLAGRFHGVTPVRRYSSPSSQRAGDVCRRPRLPLPHEASSSDTLEKTATTEAATLCEARPRPSTSLSCDHLVRALTEHSRLQTSSVRDLASWSQETLF